MGSALAKAERQAGHTLSEIDPRLYRLSVFQPFPYRLSARAVTSDHIPQIWTIE
jgi:hypothetical protein